MLLMCIDLTILDPFHPPSPYRRGPLAQTGNRFPRGADHIPAAPKLVTQGAHVRVHGAGVTVKVIAPHLVKQLVARERPIGRPARKVRRSYSLGVSDNGFWSSQTR